LITAEVQAAIEQAVSAQEGKAVRIRNARAASGGCINQAYHVEFTSGLHLFLKYNKSAPAGLFAREAEGLELLGSARSIRVPDVYCVTGGRATIPFLLLEDVSVSSSVAPEWENPLQLGGGLAGVHRTTAESYGLETDNYLGPTLQPNGWHVNWPSFFCEHRISYMLRLLEVRAVPASELRVFRDALPRMHAVLAQAEPEAPSLVHGDLWSGNVIAAATGHPVLIDPAVYFGDREVDIAMTRLFGGFDADFYAAYDEAYPLREGWQERQDIYNLYHLLHHSLLFGGSYLSQARRVAEAFASG
jgi:fructosamine-3-kinase